MNDVNEPFKVVFFSFEQAKIQEANFLSPSQAKQIENQEIICYQDGFLCALPTRFFPILINDHQEFWIRSWPRCHKFFQDKCFCISKKPEDTFQERFWIESFSSLGLYLNGKRLKKAPLQNGDWIFIGGHSFFWYDALLLCPGISQENANQSLPLKVASLKKDEKIQPSVFFEELNDLPTIQVESPINMEMEEERNLSLTSSMNPGTTMLLSTVVSTLSSLMVSNSSHLFPTLLSGGLGAIGFLGFYGWQARKRQSKKRQAKAKSRNDYLHYLQDQIEKVETLRQDKNVQFSLQKQRLLSFDPSLKHSQCLENWKLPLAAFKKPYIQLELPKLSWQFAQSPSQKALSQLESFDSYALSWSFLYQGQGAIVFYQNHEQLIHFYLLWCWMVFNQSRRFAWIGFLKPHSFHPASLIEGQDLYFESLQAFLRYKTKYPSIEWTICVHPNVVETLNLASLFLLETNPSSFLKSQSPQETWILCTHSSQTLFFQNIELSSQPLIFPFQVSSSLWRQSAYLPFETSEKGSLPWSCTYFLQENHEEDLSLTLQANLKVEMAPGIFWDLKEEGPHALVAGVTGSGKSEGLCSILFQLALQNSADLVRFVLIDFKGGSFLAPLQDLPHTAALLTNLVGQEIHRLEIALQRELDRRQSVLLKWLEKNPGSIPDLEHCQDPKTHKIFSHILICVDEFGQLKARFPEFLKFLQETARIGRSLGIHLILSTQKPAGLVDEQIWANCKAKLCFPVLDLADSREVLGHEGATKLKKSGEFILQIGSESEKKGRAFYLKKPASGRSSLFTYDSSWKEISSLSLQDAIRQKILERQEKIKPLMICDPKSKADDFCGILEDCIDQAPFFVLPSSGLVLAIGQEENVKLLAIQLAWQCAQEEKIPLNATSFSLFHAQRVTLSSLWLLEASTHSLAIFVNLDEIPFELLEFLLSKSNVVLILVASQISFRQEKILTKVKLRLIAGIGAKDQLALASDGRLRQEEGFPVVHALYDNHEKRLIVGKKLPSKPEKVPFFSLPVVNLKSSSSSLLEGRPNLIGIEAKTLKPFFLTQKGLTIAWSQPTLKEKANHLVLRLQLENPLLSLVSHPTPTCLCLLDLSNELDGANLLQKALEAGPVLFVGKGLSAWQYLLQLTLPMETVGDALLIENGYGCDIQMASFHDF